MMDLAFPATRSLADQILEHIAALLETTEFIEGRASRREHDHIPRLSDLERKVECLSHMGCREMWER